MSNAPISFLCASYVHDRPEGPLFIIALEDGHLRVVSVVYGTENVRRRLDAGAPLDEVVASLKALQHTAVSFPVSRLKKVVWNDFSSTVVFTYDAEKKPKRVTACIAADEDRTGLLRSIQDCVGQPVRCHAQPASILAVAWSRILGAGMAFAGTIAFYLAWDPVAVGRIRGGQIALLLGRNGCALVGAAIFAACCASAWLAIRKRSRYYTVVIGRQGGTDEVGADAIG